MGRSLEIVVVAYGAPELLRSALLPLRSDFPITVVDNSSSALVREVALESGAAYWDAGRNGGFGAGVNFALDRLQTPGADVLLLNPDAVIDPQGVRDLHAALQAGDDIASVGAAQTDEGGQESQVTWPYPRPAQYVMDALGLRERTAGTPEYVIGSVLLLRAEALQDVGRFDEEFFLYAEEADWEFRALQAGWRNVTAPKVRAVHIGAATSTDPWRREVFLHAGQERFLRKHHGWWGWQIARWSTAVGSLPRAVMLRGERGRAARVRGWLFARGPVSVEKRLRAGT